MEFLSHFANAFSDGVDNFIGWFTGLFQYFVSIGVRQETLILILVAGGVSLLILLVLAFIGLSKLKLGRISLKIPRSEKPKQHAQVGPKNATRFSALFKPKTPSETAAAAAPKGSGGGFAIFKKKKAPQRPKPSEQPNVETGSVADKVVGKLSEIERDMLALKELYQSGHITVDVYVSESRTLYEKAKALT